MFAGTAGGPEEHSAQHGHLARGKQMQLQAMEPILEGSSERGAQV